MSKRKKLITKIIFGTFLAITSIKLLFGFICGYLTAKLYMDKIYGKKIGKINFGSLYLPLGNYKLHIHHWIYPWFFLGTGSLFDISFFTLTFPFGFLVGVSIHDIFTDKNWYKIILRR